MLCSVVKHRYFSFWAFKGLAQSEWNGETVLKLTVKLLRKIQLHSSCEGRTTARTKLMTHCICLLKQPFFSYFKHRKNRRYIYTVEFSFSFVMSFYISTLWFYRNFRPSLLRASWLIGDDLYTLETLLINQCFYSLFLSRLLLLLLLL